MAKDHFLAQTYLKHFGDPSQGGMLHAYRKADEKYFPCWPKDVCHEWDGDLNPVLQHEPKLLGDFRKIFEPHWNSAIENMIAGAVTPTDKFVVAAYMANMMVCTPAWRRVMQSAVTDRKVGSFKFEQAMKEKHSGGDEELLEGARMLDRGELKITIDDNYIKGKITQLLIDHACTIFSADWLILENKTDQAYLASDNPVALSFSGRPGDALTRILPITPQLCLSIRFDIAGVTPRRLTPDDVRKILQSPPQGKIIRAEAKPIDVRFANKLVVQCAEELVFSSRRDEAAAALATKYRNFRLDAEYVELASNEPDTMYQGTIIRVREAKQDHPKCSNIRSAG